MCSRWCAPCLHTHHPTTICCRANAHCPWTHHTGPFHKESNAGPEPILPRSHADVLSGPRLFSFSDLEQPLISHLHILDRPWAPTVLREQTQERHMPYLGHPRWPAPRECRQVVVQVSPFKLTISPRLGAQWGEPLHPAPHHTPTHPAASVAPPGCCQVSPLPLCTRVT